MKRFPLVLCLSVFLLAACGKSIHLPRPDPQNKESSEQKELSSKKDGYLKKITALERDHRELNQKISEKRSRGYNTAEAEAIAELVKKSVFEAKDLVFWEKFDELKLKLEDINILIKKTESLIKKAPLFGSETEPKKESIRRKYGLDDREWVRELRGEPQRTNKNFRGPTTIFLQIYDPTSALAGVNCWDPRYRTFEISNPPILESWYYPEDQTIYIFMETNSIIEQFMLKNDLIADERDELLARLCIAQTYGGYKLIYAGPPVTDLNLIVEQIFLGKMRGADMFGIGALSRLAKAVAVLPDLNIAAIAFNTELDAFNKKQNEEFEVFLAIVRTTAPEVLALITNLPEKEEFEKIYRQAKNADPPAAPEVLAVLEELVNIRTSADTDVEKSKKIHKLGEKQNKVFKSKLGAVSKILLWQKTLNPSEKDVEELAKIFPEKEREIKENLKAFGENIRRLAEKFREVHKDLLGFRNKGTFELVFREGKPPAVFFLLEGVRFEEKSLPNGEIVEQPDLSVKVTIDLKMGKKEPSVFLAEFKEIKIENANRFIDEVKEFQRLASFGIRFPITLSPGNYVITFVITDNLRLKTIEHVISWLIMPEEEKNSFYFLP